MQLLAKSSSSKADIKPGWANDGLCGGDGSNTLPAVPFNRDAKLEILEIYLCYFFAGANFWAILGNFRAILAILGNFWAIMGNFG